MKINITHPKVYAFDAKSTLMKTGLQEVDDKLAKALIARGVAFDPSAKAAKAKAAKASVK